MISLMKLQVFPTTNFLKKQIIKSKTASYISQKIYFFVVGEMNMKLDGLERSKAVQEMTSTFQDIMVSWFVYESLLHKFYNNFH